MPIKGSTPFVILITLFVPSVLCYILIFVQAIRKGILKKHIHSHIVLAVLTCSFLQVNLRQTFFFSISSYIKVTTEVPILLSYLRNGIAAVLSDGFCKFWACQDYSFNVMILMLTAHTAIERYLLIFHRIAFHRHRIIVHYLPMIFCCIYPIGLYFSLIFFYPCANEFDYTMITCGGPCYFYEPTLSTFDQFINLVLPVAISTILSLTLLIRIVRQKQRMQQRNIWRKNRRLTIQLLYIIILHNIVWLPMVICSTIMLFDSVSQSILTDLAINMLPIGIYVVILLCPFISLLSLPEVWPEVAVRIFPLAAQPRPAQLPRQLPMCHTHTTPRMVVSN